ncbi:ABC transporter permease [Agrobacterium sp. AGB01]|nr:ABC transporter permease [Agrobacterium sp. AGB01]
MTKAGGKLRALTRKLIQAAFVAWASFTLAFAILYWLPGDPVSIMLGPDAHLNPAELAKLRAQYGFDRPILIQYFDALWRAVQLDFGKSLVTGKSVTESIVTAAPVTAGLAAISLIIAILFGVLFAVMSLDLPGFPRTGFVVSKIPAVLVAIPTFVVGLLLLQIFAFTLRWAPATGSNTWSTMVLPAITLAIPGAGILGQVLAKSLSRAYGEPFVRTLRARGYSEFRILRHAMRQAALPAFTMAGLIIGGTIASAVVTETVFSRQGIGRLMQMGVTNKDINLVCGLIVFSALVYVIINLLVDLLYPILDPRVRS